MNQRQAATSCNSSAVSEGLTSDDLIQRMMVARYVHLRVFPDTLTIECVRLLALSLQENEISIEIWERAKQLEATRKARMLSR